MSAAALSGTPFESVTRPRSISTLHLPHVPLPPQLASRTIPGRQSPQQSLPAGTADDLSRIGYGNPVHRILNPPPAGRVFPDMVHSIYNYTITVGRFFPHIFLQTGRRKTKKRRLNLHRYKRQGSVNPSFDRAAAAAEKQDVDGEVYAVDTAVIPLGVSRRGFGVHPVQPCHR